MLDAFPECSKERCTDDYHGEAADCPALLMLANDSHASDAPELKLALLLHAEALRLACETPKELLIDSTM